MIEMDFEINRYLKSVLYHYNKLVFRYQKLQERQKHLEKMAQGKMSNDIRNVQQILDALVRRNQQKSLVQINDIVGTLNKTKEQPKDTVTDKGADHKNAQWY